jgi:signal transduction histidine kinase
VLAVFMVFTYRLLDAELHHKSWQSDYPEHPDWKLHGSYSEAEVRDILGEFMETSVAYGMPLALAALLIGYWLARKSVKPIAAVNEQLQSIRAPNLSQRIQLPEPDREFRDLVRHINDLLARLEKSFNDMSEYAAKVAHELRTPLAILRLKVEQAGGQIAPELAEELQAELHQLAHVVDQSLLIAKAEQGRLLLTPRPFDLAALVADMAEDFSLLAQEEDRVLHLAVKSQCAVVADPKYARQIIHNLLANGLKHGQGEVRVTLRRRGESCLLTITNRLRRQHADPPQTLGLGLRVVDTLLALQAGLKCRRRPGRGCYTTWLSFPAVPADVELLAAREPMPAALDPGI